LNPSIATLQDAKYVYILNKFPAGGELFSHLASAGFFSEEVPDLEISSPVALACFVIAFFCVPLSFCVGSMSFQVARFYIGSMVCIFACYVSSVPVFDLLFSGAIFGVFAWERLCFQKHKARIVADRFRRVKTFASCTLCY
jgi:hypothetical protein